MHTFVIAEHPEFGKIRTVEKDGKIWFCAKDVASSLGYANARDAIDRHCKQKGVCVHDIPTRGGRQKIKFIDEGNVYRLIAGSRLPSAERFESWIFDDLVPRTVKEGGYLLDIKGETDSELLSRALLLAENRIKERDRHISVVREILIVLADLCLDVLQLPVQPSCLLGFAFGTVAFGIPKGKGNITLTAETRRRSVDGNTPHDRDTAIFYGLVLGVEQNSKGTPHNSIIFVTKLLFIELF